MTGTPELDEVAAARQKLAEHALLPWWYWALYVPVAVVIVGYPVLDTLLSPTVAVFGVLYPAMAVLLLSSWLVRWRTGVHLSRRLRAFPSVWRVWAPTLALGVVGDLAISQLVRHDQRTAALALIPVVAVVLVAGTVGIRFAMRADIRAGRVRP